MVSVCMATYNGAVFIKEQINSILIQLGPEDELIISDDSSSDNTISIIRSFNDSRITLSENNLFRDPVLNFQNALLLANGDFIFLCDQDDVWVKGKVEVLIKSMATYDMVTSDCQIVDGHSKVIAESYLKTVDGKAGLLRNLFLKTSPYIGCCMAFNRKVLEKALPFPKKIKNHDYWIALIAEAYFKPKIIYQPYVLYRRHSNNISNTGNKSTNSLYQKLVKRIDIIIPLVARFFK